MPDGKRGKRAAENERGGDGEEWMSKRLKLQTLELQQLVLIGSILNATILIIDHFSCHWFQLLFLH